MNHRTNAVPEYLVCGVFRLFGIKPEEQKNTAGGKQSMKAYIWSLEMAAFDNQ